MPRLSKAAHQHGTKRSPVMKKHRGRFRAVTAMAALICLLTIGQAGAWNQNHLEQLLKLRHCPFCDLSGADLSGKDLSGHNFYRANLKNANLSNSNFAGSSFVQADLRGANLNGAILDGANFSGANSWFNDDLTCASPSIGGCYDECPPGMVCH